ncbi:hypothetical protein LWE61_14980 [Sphingobium sufflavum]|uniref:hypothetical protein n=1 Tax=Sphingobium sufflavum TaxID=1129547 RepID=UPI001F184DC2|nr:hypothetical protein [Sphingobium sufflavum]MCE7797854.1 hypothetical protein [Sphingobium sufflavum]
MTSAKIPTLEEMRQIIAEDDAKKAAEHLATVAAERQAIREFLADPAVSAFSEKLVQLDGLEDMGVHLAAIRTGLSAITQRR